jgi:hypothetical protein
MAGEAYHTYLRLTPELRAQVDGPHKGIEPPVTGKRYAGSQGFRHPILQGFDETDILPFGGLLDPLRVDAGAEVLLTFIPQFPVYPPEKAWMRVPKTDIPGLILRDRVAFIPADLDRQYGRSNLPDHGNLLRNIIRWAAEGPNASGHGHHQLPLTVEGAGLVDTHLYHQPGRLILHLVNLTNENTWRQPLDELIAIGPLKVKVKLPPGITGHTLRRLVTTGAVTATVSEGWCHFEIKSILDHEVIVIA